VDCFLRAPHRSPLETCEICLSGLDATRNVVILRLMIASSELPQLQRSAHARIDRETKSSR